MYPRVRAIEGTKKYKNNSEGHKLPVSASAFSSSSQFGAHVFNRSVMQRMLPREIYNNVINAMEGREKIRQEFADPIAVAMKEWAISHGATHFTHWFQPLTGSSAEKHDAFIEWASPDEMIEQFTGKQLIQGEPDASSFPSGGLRSTYEARGYTGWDPTSPVFVWKEADGVTLCIPSVFFSWTGDVLDNKIPVHRSEKKLNKALLKLLHHTGIEATRVYTTIGLEQEYFVIDRALRNLRPDLLLAGRTVFGAPSPKGQELQDHYFGSVKERILSFMHDFEEEALKLGIPVKTRHNEVAPSQYEVAPVFERASLGIDHNIQLMELMRKIAVKHNLAVLLHEKPFHGINGSGKHCNWSIATDTGINLLDPTDSPQNNIHFLVLLTAVIHAVWEYSSLLRAAIGSAANDFRLGGHEAPPAIISIYLGIALENLLEDIEKHGIHKNPAKKSHYDLGILGLPDLTKDYTDRNRTSPFAFTGNKFEYRALGSSASASLTITVLNTIIAVTLDKMMEKIEANLKGKSRDDFIEASIPVVRQYLKESKGIRFAGDNYSEAWVKEAARRKLPNLHNSIDAFVSLKEKKTAEAFEGILTPQELTSRYDILTEHYSFATQIEAKLMLELFQTQVLPAAMKQQENYARSIAALGSVMKGKKPKEQIATLKTLNDLIEKAIALSRRLEAAENKAETLPLVKKAEFFCYTIRPLMDKFRELVDKIETLVDDSLWPMPKYRELLFVL